MNLREMTKGDMEYMADHSVSQGVFNKQPKRIDLCYTLEDEGEILGVGGISFINPTTCWCWCDIGELAEGRMRIGYRVIREWLNKLVKLHRIKRLQCYAVVDFPEAIRMVKHLGFEKESRMKNFIGDKDAFLFVRIT